MKAATMIGMGVWVMVAAGVQGATIPDTPQGKHIAALVEAFNKGDEATMRAFIADHYAKSALQARPVEARLGVYMDLWRRMQGLDVTEVEVGGPTQITVTATTRLLEDTARLGFEFEPETPYGIIGVRFNVEPGQVQAGEAQPKLTAEQVKAEAEKFAQRVIDAGAFSGAVLVAKDGKVLVERAGGMASQRFGVANTVETKFNLGSCNKMFTAVAVAQLAQQGRLSFEDKVGKHLPDFPSEEVRDEVTIHHLLTHTSGMGDYFGPLFEKNWTRVRTLQDFVPYLNEEPLIVDPGSRFVYSNAGYIVLGLIIEKASGQSYFDYVRQYVFEPAGMTNTDSYDVDIPTANLAIGHTRLVPGGRGAGPLRENLFLHAAKGASAGGGYSTVGDMQRFAQALLGHKLLNKEMTEKVMRGQIEVGEEGGGGRYGYGFGEETVNGHRTIGHTGGAPGISAVFRVFPDEGYTVVVLANVDNEAMPLARKLTALIAR